MGHLIPAGTGFHTTRNLGVVEHAQPEDIFNDVSEEDEENPLDILSELA